MKCDVCRLDCDTGFKSRVISYEEKQTRFRKRWKVVRKRRVIFVCSKCADTLAGLIRNYRRETIR